MTVADRVTEHARVDAQADEVESASSPVSISAGVELGREASRNRS